MKLLAILFLSFYPIDAEAAVHLLKGSLIEKRAVDLGSSRLELVYDSRSLNNGPWGFGWCSNLEVECVQYYHLNKFVGTPPPSTSTPTWRLLHTSQGEWIRLSFSNDNLIKIESSLGTEIFKYDDLHNMVQIAFSDGTTKEIDYNADLDVVNSVRGRGECFEKYIYAREGTQILSTTVHTYCAEEKPRISKYEFFYKISFAESDRLLRLNVIKM